MGHERSKWSYRLFGDSRRWWLRQRSALSKFELLARLRAAAIYSQAAEHSWTGNELTRFLKNWAFCLIPGQYRDLKMPELEDASSGPERVEELQTAIWKQMLRAIARAVVEDKIVTWAEYFENLRDVVRRVIATSPTCGLTVNERACLVRGLVDQIDQFEKSWPMPRATEIEHRRASGQR